MALYFPSSNIFGNVDTSRSLSGYRIPYSNIIVSFHNGLKFSIYSLIISDVDPSNKSTVLTTQTASFTLSDHLLLEFHISCTHCHSGEFFFTFFFEFQGSTKFTSFTFLQY